MSHTDSYLSFFNALIQYAPISMLTLFILGAMRLVPIIAMAPFFGGRTPAPIRMGLLVVLTVVLLPHIALTARTLTVFNVEFMFLCAKELFIGFILAFFISIPFYMAQAAGVTIDFLRGSSSLQVQDPTMQAQTSPIGQLYNFVLIALFYQMNGPFYFFNALFDSYTVVPADGWLPISFFTFHHPVWEMVWDSTNKIMAVGIQLAAPSLLAILMTEMFLGIANRLAPQVQIAFLGMSLKSLGGLALLWLAWFFILQQMQKQTFIWIDSIHKVIPTFAG